MTQRVVNYTYGTGNPVLPDGSIDVRDGIDNLQSFDIFMNAEEDTYNQRDGDIVQTASGAIRGLGFKPASFTFTTGGTLGAGDYDKAVYNPAPNGDNNWYAWGGAMPKTVAPNSTPQTSGGFGKAAWIPKTDIILTSQITHPPLEFYGVSSVNTPSHNATILADTILAGKPIGGSRAAYSFDFTGMAKILPTATHLHIDLGNFKHTFTNFPGIEDDQCRVLFANFRFSCEGSYCKGFARVRNAQLINIINFEITDSLVILPTATTQFFGLEYSSNLFDDNEVSMIIDNLKIKNVVTVTGTSGSGTAIAMTVIGGYGAPASRTKLHQINIKNVNIDSFYSVAADQVTVIYGDSDVFRLFTNPMELTIDNCVLNNVGKRFIKTQVKVSTHINSIVAKLDNRFTTTNFEGLFEAQTNASTLEPSHFHIDYADIDFSASPSTTPGPTIFNASGMAHSITIDTLKYKNIGIYSSTQNIGVTFNDASGSGLYLLAGSSNRIVINRLYDNALQAIQCAESIVRNFNIWPVLKTATFPLTNARLFNGVFNNLDTNTRVATVLSIDDVTLNYTTGTVARRPMMPVANKTVRVNGMEVNGLLPTGHATFDSPGGAGTMFIRDYRSVNQALGFFSTGTWTFILDNCNSDVITGAGVVSIKRAQYV